MYSCLQLTAATCLRPKRSLVRRECQMDFAHPNPCKSHLKNCLQWIHMHHAKCCAVHLMSASLHVARPFLSQLQRFLTHEMPAGLLALMML